AIPPAPLATPKWQIQSIAPIFPFHTSGVMEGGTDTLNLYTLSATFSTGQTQINPCRPKSRPKADRCKPKNEITY
ncbi:MAG TPA: hypothetical protein VNU95_03285, partial [Candidatus Acidoferrales bacterium]|nr:hypothetical protein [Candidatus Acidoferrales bacterium]